MTIHILPPEVASQIAAGEVVERPASVVKELVENALDAGAQTITITVRDAGRTLVEVADDGTGIPSRELALAVERHATSKLDSADDLFHVVTLGFRGEALASIGSVSRLTLTSRTADSAAGSRVRVDGGNAAKVEQVGAPVGTIVRVENLYNVPARLKFLKQDSTERRQIDALATRYALAYPAVQFKLSDGNTTALQTAGDGDRRAILAALYGVDVARQLLEVMAEEDGLALTGFISPVSLTRSNRKDITFFINGRWVQDTALTTGLIQAYHTLLMVGRYPLAAIFMRVPPEDVDVNVHPAKAEVRFRNPDRLFSLVQRATRRALLAYSPVPQVAPTLWGGRSQSSLTADQLPASGVGLDWAMAGEGLKGEGTPVTAEDGDAQVAQSPPTAGSQASIPNLPLLRLIGQIGATYLVAEGPDGLYLIDQHAAHERVLFEKLMRQRERRMLSSQTLLSPQVVQLPPAQAELLQAQLGALESFGFRVEPFGPNAFQVRAMPALFGDAEAASALRSLVEDFEEDESPLQNRIEAKIAGRVCKRLAVRAGMALSPDEQRALLTDLEACDSPRTCPHGRPTMIHLSVDLLERQFGRRGAR